MAVLYLSVAVCASGTDTPSAWGVLPSCVASVSLHSLWRPLKDVLTVKQTFAMNVLNSITHGARPELSMSTYYLQTTSDRRFVWLGTLDFRGLSLSVFKPDYSFAIDLNLHSS